MESFGEPGVSTLEKGLDVRRVGMGDGWVYCGVKNDRNESA
jgi:hypothetical protein